MQRRAIPAVRNRVIFDIFAAVQANRSRGLHAPEAQLVQDGQQPLTAREADRVIVGRELGAFVLKAIPARGQRWFNLRPSNTEPLLRLNVEGVDAPTMERVRDEVLAAVRAQPAGA